ncbi:hypothetical protein LTR08_003771 [Meristemomyces frigidus]|nr:hypothetical protein LTR08_003771 [Meristemomyces frigidus]
MASTQPTLAQIAQSLLEQSFHNIIHDLILSKHREHKLLLATLDPTTKLPHCDTCKLPRLLEPPLAPKTRGAIGEPPRDTQYCERRPWSKRPGHDIYDNPFPKADATGRPPTKKEREALAAAGKNGKKGDGEGTPASEEPNGSNTHPPSPSENGNDASQRLGGGGLEKGEKKASKIDEKLKKGEYVPWHTCPSCKRSLLITRFAKHLEQCMGLSGRQASRNAMAKMSGSVNGSRAGTPGLGEVAKGGDGLEDDDDAPADVPAGKTAGGGVRKKLLKKGLDKKIKKSKEGKLAKPSSSAGPKRSPQPSKAGSPAPSIADKRDRDEMLLGDEGDEDEGDTVQVKKRRKLERVGSLASLGSTALESVDGGSFVGDGDGSGEE